MTCRTARNQKIVYPMDDDPAPFARLPSRLKPAVPDRHPAGSWLLCIAILFAVAIGLAIDFRPARGQDNPAAYKLVWTVGAPTPQGPVVSDVNEVTSFADDAGCQAFGGAMTARMADWVRGVLRADWGHPVMVKFRCELAGQDS